MGVCKKVREMSDVPKKPTYDIKLDVSGTGKFEGDAIRVERLRNTQWYIVCWAIVIASPILCYFLPPIASLIVSIIAGAIGIYISPKTEKPVPHHHKF